MRVERSQYVGEASIVRSKVVAPVTQCMTLVDDQEAEVSCDRRKHPVSELRVREPLRGHQEHVKPSGRDGRLDLRPRLDVGGVERGSRQTGAFRSLDLVAHQAQQRRHDQGEAGVLMAADGRCRPVHRRLAPTGRLHDENPCGRLTQCCDCRLLVAPQGRIGSGERLYDVGRDLQAGRRQRSRRSCRGRRCHGYQSERSRQPCPMAAPMPPCSRLRSIENPDGCSRRFC